MLDDGTYISWWPSAEGRDGKTKGEGGPLNNIYEAPAIQGRQYEDDLNGEGGREPWSKNVTGLNEANMKDWWQAFSSNTENKWATFSQNCSTVAAMALEKGGATTAWYDLWNGWNMIWTPEDVKRYAEAICE